MSVCTFLASDYPLPEVSPEREYPLFINVDEGTVDDGGADDNFFLRDFPDVGSYTDKTYGVALEWRYTQGRVKRILAYIGDALQNTDVVELWHVWLTDYCEFEDRPFIHRKTVPLGELTAECIRELEDAEIWNTPDRMYPNRPSFYCISIYK